MPGLVGEPEPRGSEHVHELLFAVRQLPQNAKANPLIVAGEIGSFARGISFHDVLIDVWTPKDVHVSDTLLVYLAGWLIAQAVLDSRQASAEPREVAPREDLTTSERTVIDLNMHGLHPELIRMIGRMRYRTSYGQNQWAHSIEVGFLCGLMASELGLNAKLARRIGLLHDLGKAVDHEVEGPHALIGSDLAKKYGESNEVIHSIAAHHEEVPPGSTLAILVQAADTLSGARPGARQEMLESYVKRLEDLERIAPLPSLSPGGQMGRIQPVTA